MPITIKFKKLHKDAKLPSYAHEGDAGFDMFAIEKVVLKVGERASIPTGLAMEIPKGCVGLFWDKSGLSHRAGIKTLGGVIDSSYRGEVKIGVVNLGQADFIFEPGDKVAQMLIQKCETAKIKEVSVLKDTTRGEKGFGSTGRK